MSKHGYTYSTPVAAYTDRRWSGSDRISPEQIATAQTDIKCKLQTNLVGIDLSVQRSYDLNYIARHREALDERLARISTFVKAHS